MYKKGMLKMYKTQLLMQSINSLLLVLLKLAKVVGNGYGIRSHVNDFDFPQQIKILPWRTQPCCL